LEPELDRLDKSDSVGRRLVQRLLHWRPEASSPHAPEARVIAVASGKGGTGKSFFVTNLAVALHQAGRRVAVVDCDYGLGNAHLLFGVNPRLSMYHLVSGLAPASSVLTPTPHGPNLIAGGSGISRLAELEEHHFVQLAHGLGMLAHDHDALLLDCAAGLSPQSLLTALAAEALVIVTNAEIAALTDAYALIKCLAKQPRVPEIHVVVNRVMEPGLGLPTFERLAEVVQRFVGRSLHYIGEIAENAAVSHRRLGQPPLLVSHPKCSAATAVLAVMRNLERATGPIAARGSPACEGVERRILRLVRER
jgi:flagellar biosynthesis protein FlhG